MMLEACCRQAFSTLFVYFALRVLRLFQESLCVFSLFGFIVSVWLENFREFYSR